MIDLRKPVKTIGRKHFLYNCHGDKVATFSTFNPFAIKVAIRNYLLANPADEVTHEKELSERDKKIYGGNDVLNFYAMNKQRVPSKMTFKGGKTYYQPLTN